MKITRPVWRRFAPKFEANAVAWVKRGGAAVIVHSNTRLQLLLEAGPDGKPTELALWAVLALEQQKPRLIKEGKAKGLFTILAVPHAREAVLDWCERDAGHPGHTRTLDLDCLDCGACCHEANVLLDESDLDRFREGGRADLTTSRYIKRTRDGKIRLRFAKDGRCQNLLQDNKCRIYPLRPFNCSVFPMGSEACLAAREMTLNLRDDVDAKALRP